MKKTLSYILAIVVCLATLCGCGDTPSGGQTTDGPRDSVMLRNALACRPLTRQIPMRRMSLL